MFVEENGHPRGHAIHFHENFRSVVNPAETAPSQDQPTPRPTAGERNKPPLRPPIDHDPECPSPGKKNYHALQALNKTSTVPGVSFPIYQSSVPRSSPIPQRVAPGRPARHSRCPVVRPWRCSAPIDSPSASPANCQSPACQWPRFRHVGCDRARRWPVKFWQPIEMNNPCLEYVLHLYHNRGPFCNGNS